jgi:hypothetical protein
MHERLGTSLVQHYLFRDITPRQQRTMRCAEIVGRCCFAREPDLAVPVRARQRVSFGGACTDSIEAVAAKCIAILSPAGDLCGNRGGKARSEHCAQGVMRGSYCVAVTKSLIQNYLSIINPLRDGV